MSTHETAKHLLIVALAITGASCHATGPSESLSGHWMAIGIGHSSVFGLELQQNDEEIIGTACHTDGIAIFRGAPVRGEYPTVLVDVTTASLQPCCTSMAGARFVGRQDGTNDIVGTYRTATSRIDLRFRRSDLPVCR
jgi:hypothetical protein